MVAARGCTCGCPTVGLAGRPEVAGAELPPRSAASLRLTRPPALSLGFGSGSDGSLRPPAALMSVEEEPAAQGLETGRRDSAPGLGKGRGGGGETRGTPSTGQILFWTLPALRLR